MLELQHLVVGYGRQKTVLHDVSLSFPDGQMAVVMGHNGAGKTTLLNVMFGLLAPEKGTIVADGPGVVRSDHARARRVRADHHRGRAEHQPDHSPGRQAAHPADGPSGAVRRERHPLRRAASVDPAVRWQWIFT